MVQQPERRVSEVSFRVAFERDDLRPYPSDETEVPEERITSDPREAAEIAVEMANRPGESGGSVIVAAWRWGAPIYLTQVESGDLVARVERELRKKGPG